MNTNITISDHSAACSHDQHGWALHRITESYPGAQSRPLAAGEHGPLTVHQTVTGGITSGRALLAAAKRSAAPVPHASIPADRRTLVELCADMGLAFVGRAAVNRPVTLDAVLDRRRRVRALRYGNDWDAPMTLPGVAYASTGAQVLSDAAVSWAETARFDQPSHAAEVVAKRAVKPETAAKRARLAIAQVAAGKRAETYARERIESYVSVLDVDVYDALVDELDAVLDGDASAADALSGWADLVAESRVYSGVGSIQAEHANG